MSGENQRKRACVVVLGDIGRSPRMQYHAKSLIENDFEVEMIGYLDTKPSSIPTATIHELYFVPEFHLPAIFVYILKTLWQAITLSIALCNIKRPNLLLLQNPPGIPAIFICFFYCYFSNVKFVIDWHNYTHTILALSSAPQGLLVRFAKWFERFFGRKAKAHFCVTKAMKEDLQNNWGIEAVVLYDRPPDQFHPIDLDKKHDIYMKLSKDYSQFLPKDCHDFKKSGVLESTALTQKMNDGTIVYKKNRPAILVSSTSWTPDEDFRVLLKALKEYDAKARNCDKYPYLICIITGQGPQKKLYKEEISRTEWSNVSIITPWLEAEDYPLVLAAADLGVCLHWSSSGLDLPMKVVDMFGCGLPVCAINFHCISELVKAKENGFIFETSDQLLEQITYWFLDFPENADLNEIKAKFEKNLHQFQSLRWRENWNLNALPVLSSLI